MEYKHPWCWYSRNIVFFRNKLYWLRVVVSSVVVYLRCKRMTVALSVTWWAQLITARRYFVNKPIQFSSRNREQGVQPEITGIIFFKNPIQNLQKMNGSPKHYASLGGMTFICFVTSIVFYCKKIIISSVERGCAFNALPGARTGCALICQELLLKGS